jgi:hypothetical protein
MTNDSLSFHPSSLIPSSADTLDKLAAAGWHATVAMHDVLLSRADVQTGADATRRLLEAGVDPQALMIVEEVTENDLA